MARAAVTKTAPATDMVSWEDKLAKEADIAAGMEQNSGGGQFFSLKSGVLSFNDSPMPGNQMGVVILDTIFEHVFYEGKFDAQNPTPPTCFAFGKDEETMVPHDVVFKADQQQNPTCKGCPRSEWGSAETGRGKACRQTRRMGLIPAGTFDQQGRFQALEDEDHFTGATVGFLKIPVTSVKAYAGFVKSVAGTLRRPPHGIFTKIKVEPDPKNQFRVMFEPLAAVPNALMPAIMKRHEEVRATIEFPYSLEMDGDKAKTPAAKNQRRKY